MAETQNARLIAAAPELFELAQSMAHLSANTKGLSAAQLRVAISMLGATATEILDRIDNAE